MISPGRYLQAAIKYFFRVRRNWGKTLDFGSKSYLKEVKVELRVNAPSF